MGEEEEERRQKHWEQTRRWRGRKQEAGIAESRKTITRRTREVEANEL